jgi:membrane-bound ClpP family serine protease
MIIAAFITTFGATGAVLLATTHLHRGLVVLISFGSGFVGGFIIWLILSKLIRAVSGTSEARVAELIGLDAEVITPIRSSAVGEIAYVAGGSRYSSPAKSIDNTSIDRNRIVKIVRIVGPTYFVREIKEEELKGKT